LISGWVVASGGAVWWEVFIWADVCVHWSRRRVCLRVLGVIYLYCIRLPVTMAFVSDSRKGSVL
jgi:hypothetical protein